jgi:hypothetical protein
MNKILSKILISVIMVGIFMLPISPVFNIDSKYLSITKNITNAGLLDSKYMDDFSATTSTSEITYASIKVKMTLTSKRDNAFNDYSLTNWALNGPLDKGGFSISVSEREEFFTNGSILEPTWGELGWERIGPAQFEFPNDLVGAKIEKQLTFAGLKPNTRYYVGVLMADSVLNDGDTENREVIPGSVTAFTTLNEGEGATPEENSSIYADGAYSLECYFVPIATIIGGAAGGVVGAGVGAVVDAMTNKSAAEGLKGCVANLFYLLYQVSAWVGHLSAKFLDFFIYYTTSSASFNNAFINKGWAGMRDIANIFFIIALLFIAFKTILNLNSSNQKKLIVYIILFALLINFSLFTTRAIIDASNILAKIFYNNIVSKDEKGNIIDNGVEGQKSISIGIVEKYNPQTIMAKDIAAKNVGTYIFIILVSIGITLYTAYMFFAVALLFVARIISLSFSMIFSPVAFASYTIPWKIPGIGNEDWWSDLLKNAFLAPIFVFLLYLIVMFSGFLNKIVVYNSETNPDMLERMMFILVPFALIAGILMKARKMAQEYAGEVGKAVIKAAKIAGGIAVGTVATVAAAAGAAVVGGGSAAFLASSGGKALAQRALTQRGIGGFVARTQMKALNYGKKATFDVRQSVLGKQMKSMTGIDYKYTDMVGLTPKPGGYQGKQDRKAEKTMRQFDIYKTKMSDDEVKDWSDGREEVIEYKRQRDQAREEKLKKNPELNTSEFNNNYDAEHINSKPKEFTSGAQLDAHNMKLFQDRLVNSGPLAWMSKRNLEKKGGLVNKNNYQDSSEYAKMKAKNKNIDKEESQENIIRDINNKRIRKEKLTIGRPAGVVTAGMVGGVVSGEEDAYKKMDKLIDRGTKIQKDLEDLKNNGKDLEEDWIKENGDFERDKEKKREEEKYKQDMIGKLETEAKEAGKTFEQHVSDASEDLKSSMEEIRIKENTARDKKLRLQTRRDEIEADTKKDRLEKAKLMSEEGISSEKIKELENEQAALHAE